MLFMQISQDQHNYETNRSSEYLFSSLATALTALDVWHCEVTPWSPRLTAQPVALLCWFLLTVSGYLSRHISNTEQWGWWTLCINRILSYSSLDFSSLRYPDSQQYSRPLGSLVKRMMKISTENLTEASSLKKPSKNRNSNGKNIKRRRLSITLAPCSL